MAVSLPKPAQYIRSKSLESPHPVHGSRSVVLSLDSTEDGQKVLQWACKLYTPGDVFHIVHVAKILSPQGEVFHGVVGTSLKFHESTIEESKEAIATVKAWWKKSINATLEEKGIPHVPHFFVDTSNAPAETIAKTVAQVADEVDAAFIIAAKSNKTFVQKYFVGSVAQAISKMTSRSLFLVV